MRKPHWFYWFSPQHTHMHRDDVSSEMIYFRRMFKCHATSERVKRGCMEWSGWGGGIESKWHLTTSSTWGSEGNVMGLYEGTWHEEEQITYKGEYTRKKWQRKTGVENEKRAVVNMLEVPPSSHPVELWLYFLAANTLSSLHQWEQITLIHNASSYLRLDNLFIKSLNSIHLRKGEVGDGQQAQTSGQGQKAQPTLAESAEL